MPQDGKKARSAVHALFDGESILLLQSSSAFTITQDPNPAQRRSGNHADGSNVTITQSPDATVRRGESHADDARSALNSKRASNSILPPSGSDAGRMLSAWLSPHDVMWHAVTNTLLLANALLEVFTLLTHACTLNIDSLPVHMLSQVYGRVHFFTLVGGLFAISICAQ